MFKGLEGANGLVKRLDELADKVEVNSKKLQKEALKEGADEARSRVPVDTGELRDSIEEGEDYYNVTASHALPVEFGTFKSPAQPYFRPSVDKMGKYVEENIGGVLK